jgi:hypothetical protein
VLVHGIELRPAAVPMASGRLPSSLFYSFFLLPLGTAVIYILTYIHIFISILENLCCYTIESPCPNRNELGPWVLG